MMNPSLRKTYQRYRNPILYALIGTLCTGLECAAFYLLSMVIQYQIANAIAFHLGILTSFILNRKFNFKTGDKTILRFLSFYSIQIVGLVISSISLGILIEDFGLGKLLAKGCSVVVVALMLFLLNSHITFRKKKP